VHEIYRRWRTLADSYGGPSGRALVGEVNLDPARAARYTRRDELHQAFAFGFLTAPWDADAWRRVAAELLATRQPGGGAVTWVGENHDVVRSPTRYAPGDPRRGAARARAALLAVLGLPGGAYLYQGQELGLPEADVPASARQDPAWARSGHSRDGCRVPIPWRRDPAGTFGFSPAGGAPPWLPVPDGWGAYSVEAAEADPASTLHLCRAALALRRRLHADGVLGADDAVTWNLDRGRLVAWRSSPAAECVVAGSGPVDLRGRFALVVAMGDGAVPLPACDVLLTSAPLDAGRLPADTAAWVRTHAD
jgi:alpha-glucosidase